MQSSDAPRPTPANELQRKPLVERYVATRQASEALAARLSPEDAAVQSMPDVSPTKWHLAHTTWFFETFVLPRAIDGHRAFVDDYEYLFNSYYQTVGPQYPRPQRGLLTRPSLTQVLDYRHHVDDLVRRIVERGLDDDLATIVELGIHHEQQHQELILTDIKHVLSHNPLEPAYAAPYEDEDEDEDLPVVWLRFDGGVVEIGHDGDGFAFDNESPRHRVYLEPFELASRPVTAAEFAAFIADDGYDRPELWLSEGWSVRSAEGWGAPLYWQRDGTDWSQFTLTGQRGLGATEPVCHLSYYEADAYARWAGARLPTETEWEVAARGAQVDGNFVDDGRFHPAPRSKGGPLHRIFGDVWEWTASAYGAYPGYVPAAGALGEYNGKFMCSQLVLRGGSCATPRSHMRPTYRNFFYPKDRWQFSGLRLARNQSPTA